MSNIRLLLADDHTLLRAGIRSLLEKMAGVEVVAEAADGREALDLMRTHQPNVVLMDIAMAGLNGLDATARIVREFPNAKVIILSMHANEEYVLQTLRAGASGYLLKDAATAELELAIQSVARGDTYLSPTISRRVIEDYLGRISGTKSPSDQLTPRQREILQLIAEGKTTKEIAFLLKLSVKTVETHRSQLMDRLGVYDVPGLVRHAMRMGLVPPES
jgi:DNA-binding NarL/FixJ family response regulator